MSWVHEVSKGDWPVFWKGLKDRTISFELKKKKFMGYKTIQDTADLKLVKLGTACEYEKEIKLMGAPVTVTIQINKATRQKEMVWDTITKQTMGPILPPFQLKGAARP
jgi:hypothetical protein